MPCLYALGHRWRIGSDDLVIPATLEAAVHSIWLATFASVFCWHRHAFSCLGGNTLRTFYAGGLFVTSLNLGLLVAIIHTSLKGTVINPAPRHRISKLVAAKAGLDMLLLVMSIIGTRWAFYTDYGCEERVVKMMQTAVKGFWATTASSLMTIALILSPGKVKAKKCENLETSESVISATRKTWNQRLQSISKFLGLEDHPAITSIANLFTDFFKEKADLVPSDLLVALLILENQQEERKQQLTRQLVNNSLTLGEQPKVRSWMNPEVASHYMKFACGCYGWPMYVFKSPLASLGLMKVLTRGRYIPRSLPSHIVADNKFLANTTVIKMVTGLHDDDLVHATFHNKLFEIPFYVALDHETESIVVAVRGTLSLEDVLTDLMAFASETIPLGNLGDAQAHEGMLSTARYIMKKLIGRDTAELPEVTELSSERPLLDIAGERLQAFVGHQKAKEYKLVIVGHSLGAGVAAILAILLQKIPKYKNLRCFAYSPPGGLLSLWAAQHCEAFVCSVILGDDIVGRLGITTVFDLKVKLFHIIQNCDIGKHEVFGGWLLNLINHLMGTSKVKNITGHKTSWEDDPAAQRTVERFKAEMQAAIDSTQSTVCRLDRMYPPGSIMYIREHKGKGWLRPRNGYQAVFTTCESAMFDEILLSHDMMRHHLPWVVMAALEVTTLDT